MISYLIASGKLYCAHEDLEVEKSNNVLILFLTLFDFMDPPVDVMDLTRILGPHLEI